MKCISYGKHNWEQRPCCGCICRMVGTKTVLGLKTHGGGLHALLMIWNDSWMWDLQEILQHQTQLLNEKQHIFAFPCSSYLIIYIFLFFLFIFCFHCILTVTRWEAPSLKICLYFLMHKGVVKGIYRVSIINFTWDQVNIWLKMW